MSMLNFRIGNDPAYYERRRDQALRLAEQANDPAIKIIHQRMADRYAGLALDPSLRER